MYDPYQDLEKDNIVTYRRSIPSCKICNNTGSVTAIHRYSKSIYEFMCSCPKGYETHKNPEGSTVIIAPEWVKAKWSPSLSRNFTIYDVNLLPDLSNMKETQIEN